MHKHIDAPTTTNIVPHKRGVSSVETRQFQQMLRNSRRKQSLKPPPPPARPATQGCDTVMPPPPGPHDPTFIEGYEMADGPCDIAWVEENREWRPVIVEPYHPSQTKQRGQAPVDPSQAAKRLKKAIRKEEKKRKLDRFQQQGIKPWEKKRVRGKFVRKQPNNSNTDTNTNDSDN